MSSRNILILIGCLSFYSPCGCSFLAASNIRQQFSLSISILSPEVILSSLLGCLRKDFLSSTRIKPLRNFKYYISYQHKSNPNCPLQIYCVKTRSNFKNTLTSFINHFGNSIILMRKSEIDLLNTIEEVHINNQLLAQVPKTPQQIFLHTYASLHFLRQGQILPTLDKALENSTGSYSEILLTLSYMKHCMSTRANLDDTSFKVLFMLLSWMDKLDKLKKDPQPQLLPAVLQWQVGKLPLNHYAEGIVYFSYISRDIQNLLKSTAEFSADDLINLLGYLLPQIYYNISVSQTSSDKEHNSNLQDFVYFNQQIQYFVQTRTPYRSLTRTLLRVILSLELTPKQTHDVLYLASKYYLLFFQDKKQYPELLFTNAFIKASEAVKFSLSKELISFFKIARKLGAQNLELNLREKYDWLDSLIEQFKDTAVGQPKEQVSPYNPLGIQQTIQIGAGKTQTKTIQIYHQNSLFYFWLNIQNRDVTMRLYYVGDFQTKIQVKKLLFTEQKLTDNAKSTFIATKKGLYQLQLDNSYSWLNSKTLKFQYVILAPYQHSPNPVWLDRLLQTGQVQSEQGNQEQNSKGEITPTHQQKQSTNTVQNLPKEKKTEPQQEIVRQVQKPVQKPREVQIKSVPKKQNARDSKELKEIKENKQKVIQSPQEKKASVSTIEFTSANNKEQWKQVNLNLIDDTFSLIINTEDHTYEFQTNLADRVLKRIRNLLKESQDTQWVINGQAKQWLRQNDYRVQSKGGITLVQSPNHSTEKGKNGSKIK